MCFFCIWLLSPNIMFSQFIYIVCSCSSFIFIASVLWICHTFSTIDGIFGSLLDNCEQFSCGPSGTPTVAYVCVIFPMTHTQEWDDWIIDFNYLQLYWIIPYCFLNYHSNFTPILSIYVSICITALGSRFNWHHSPGEDTEVGWVIYSSAWTSVTPRWWGIWNQIPRCRAWFFLLYQDVLSLKLLFDGLSKGKRPDSGGLRT